MIELLATIAIMAVVLAYTVPSLSTLVRNNRLTTAANNLLASIQNARSQAVTQGATVVLCAVLDATVALPQCTNNVAAQS